MNGTEILLLILFSLVIGAVIGAIARLLVPGTARFGVLATILVGAVAALLGGVLGRQFNWSGLITTLAQIALAVVGVLLFRRPSSYR